jgi:hypothetical protein
MKWENNECRSTTNLDKQIKNDIEGDMEDSQLIEQIENKSGELALIKFSPTNKKC